MSSAVEQAPVQINLAWCKACGICYALCPTKALGADELGKATLVQPKKCTKCKICENHCPDFAISVAGGKRT
ncbi:4Fe-4S dicluster domain-containing protein [Heliobacterium undosum]|uniref:4Fe-4S dicluster domain-containing protein n=1 Tax=Heliomicrobium undosum TaxID=121734 RepID=A0A845L8Y3_9FIRM|nr:4Fe-4S binding protein [Heliomicrobium undosum]MZP30178.1 4Fe-4S dicluster domain-containing protein [Heliomicrobium undosum]